MIIGFSTGSLALGNYQLALSYMQNMEHVNAVELSSLRESELPILLNHIPQLSLQKYQYISFHAPSKLSMLSETALIQLLEQIKNKQWYIIVHPDIIHDFATWRGLGKYLCIENMDKRKPVGRTVDNLEQIFKQLPDASFCFDIAHARQVDPTMREAVMMMEKFSDRLTQVHISSVNSQSGHEQLNVETILSYKKISKLIPSNTPIIIESPVSQANMEREIKKVALVFEDALFDKYIDSVGHHLAAHYKYYR